MVAFEPICMPTMCFLKKFKVLVLLWMFKDSKKCKFLYRILSTRRRFFTAHSVHAENFLPHTQQTWNIFYRILNRRGIFFTAYSVDLEYFLPHNQEAWNNFEICHPALLCQLSRLGIIFLPHTQYTQEIFYRILSTRSIIFTAYSAGGE